MLLVHILRYLGSHRQSSVLLAQQALGRHQALPYVACVTPVRGPRFQGHLQPPNAYRVCLELGPQFWDHPLIHRVLLVVQVHHHQSLGLLRRCNVEPVMLGPTRSPVQRFVPTVPLGPGLPQLEQSMRHFATSVVQDLFQQL